MSSSGNNNVHKRLAWCRLIGIPGVHDGIVCKEDGDPATSSTCNITGPSSEGGAPPRAYLYVQCWYTTSKGSHPDASEKLRVKGEQQDHQGQQQPEGSSDDSAVLSRYSLTVHLLLTSSPAVWRCEVDSLDALRPAYMPDRAAFLRVFESTLRDADATTPHCDDEHRAIHGHHHQRSVYHVFPSQLCPTTTVARIDIRLTSRGGNASVAICAFHCSNVLTTTDPSMAAEDRATTATSRVPLAASPFTSARAAAAVSRVLATIATDMQDLACLQAASDAAHTAAAAMEARMVDMARKHQQDEESMLDGFVCILNQKKERIQQLCAEVSALHNQVSALQNALGSGNVSSGDEGNDSSDGVHIRRPDGTWGAAGPALGVVVADGTADGGSGVCIVPTASGPRGESSYRRKRTRDAAGDDGAESSGDVGGGPDDRGSGTLHSVGTATTSLDNLLQL